MRRLLALGATVVAVAIGLLPSVGAAGPAAATFPPLRPTRVLILGDSVLKGGVGAYPAALPGRDVVVDAEVNRTTSQGADALARLGSDWDVVVVMLGHNDGGNPGAYQPAARRILDQLRNVRVVSWLTIHEVRPYYPAVNQYIAGLQGTYPNLLMGDWNGTAAANPGAVAADGLHLNTSGAALMADVVRRQVEIAEWDFGLALRAFAPPTTTTTAPPTTTTAPPTTTTTSPATPSTVAPTTEPTASIEAAPADAANPEPASAGGRPENDERERNVLIAGSVVIWATIAAWGVGRVRARRLRS